jgi:hypothetical protein
MQFDQAGVEKEHIPVTASACSTLSLSILNFPFICSIANKVNAQLNVIYHMQKYLCIDLEYMKGELLMCFVKEPGRM